MTRESVIEILRVHRARLHELGVKRAALFGSLARGEGDVQSDVDLMVEIDPDARIGMFEYADIVGYLEGLFPGRVDVANRAKLKPLVKRAAERDAVYAF